MTISWDKFRDMRDTMRKGKEQMTELAETARPEDRPEYDRVCSEIFDVAKNLASDQGVYMPENWKMGSRDEWLMTKREARAVMNWVNRNRSALWPSS